MCEGEIGETTDNTRLILQLAHERNERLASYIRLTDGAIWGFLGLAVIELFKDGLKLPSIKIPLFAILLIFSMCFWRVTVRRYKESIFDGYYKIMNCEKILAVPEAITLKKNLVRDGIIAPTSDQDLEKLDSKKFNDKNHNNLDLCAFGFVGFGIFLLFYWVIFKILSLVYI
jgi:hypothetical protein